VVATTRNLIDVRVQTTRRVFRRVAPTRDYRSGGHRIEGLAVIDIVGQNLLIGSVRLERRPVVSIKKPIYSP